MNKEGLLSVIRINPLQKALKSHAAFQKSLRQKSRKKKEKVLTGKSLV